MPPTSACASPSATSGLTTTARRGLKAIVCEQNAHLWSGPAHRTLLVPVPDWTMNRVRNITFLAGGVMAEPVIDPEQLDYFKIFGFTSDLYEGEHPPFPIPIQ